MLNDISNKIILVTGSTDGIGKLTALKFAKLKAHVLVHGRNKEKTNKVVNELKDESGNLNIIGLIADFSSLADVRLRAEEVL